MTNTNKGEWLTILLKDIGWSPSDLARASKLETGVISNIQNGKRGIGTKTANKIARAVKRPTEYILRLAGELPIVDSADELSERADHLIKNYKSRATKQKALEYLEFLAVQEEKAEYRTQEKKTPPR